MTEGESVGPCEERAPEDCKTGEAMACLANLITVETSYGLNSTHYIEPNPIQSALTDAVTACKKCAENVLEQKNKR